MDDGTFPALLKTLSDSSEEVYTSTFGYLSISPPTGYQTRFTIIGSNFIELRRKLFQSVHGQSIGAL